MIFPPVIHGAGETTSRTILLKYIFSTFLKEIAELRGGEGGEKEKERERREAGTRADSNGRGAAPFIDNR